jgi:hypothetical protein
LYYVYDLLFFHLEGPVPVSARLPLYSADYPS